MYRYYFYDLKLHFWWPNKRFIWGRSNWKTLYDPQSAGIYVQSLQSESTPMKLTLKLYYPYLHFTHVSILFKFALTEIFFVDAMLLYFDTLSFYSKYENVKENKDK